MPDPQVASGISPAEWGAQFRAENPNYFRYKSMNDEDFAHAMRSSLDIDDIVDFGKHTDVAEGASWYNPLQWGTEKPNNVMVNGEITPVGAHIFGDDSKAVYGGQRFISGIPTFLSGVVAGAFDEQSAYDMVAQTIKKDSNGNPLLDENGMMDYVDGSGNIHKVTKSDMLERADKLRSQSFLPFGIGPNWKEAEEWLVDNTINFWTEHNRRQDEYLANNPGVQGYLQWQEDTPWDGFTAKGAAQLVHPQMVARAVADMLPSMTVGTLLGGAPSAVTQGLKSALTKQTFRDGVKNLTISNFAQVGGMTLMEGSGQMEESLNILINELKMDPGQAVPIASSTALVVGIINGLLEKLQFTKIAKYGAFDKEAKGIVTEVILRRFYKDAMDAGGVPRFLAQFGDVLIDNVEEGVIEAMQEINGLAMSKALESGKAATPEEAMSMYKKEFTSMQNLKDMAFSPEALNAFFTGFSGAGGMAGSVRAGGYLMNKVAPGEKVSASYDDSDGKPGIMVNIGGRIQKLFTKNKKDADNITSILEDSGENEGFTIPGLGKGIEEISSFKDLLIAMAHQANEGVAVSEEWDALTPNRPKNPEDLTEAQQILVRMQKNYNGFGAHSNLVIQDIIDKAGIDVLDQIEDGDTKDLILESLRTVQKAKIKTGTKTSLDPEVQDSSLEEYLDKNLDNAGLIAMFKDEDKFNKQLQEHLLTLDEGAEYNNIKPIGKDEQARMDKANERNARVKKVFQDPNGQWEVNDLIEAARVAVGARGMNGLKSFLKGTKGSAKKPGFKGLTKKNLMRLMGAKGLQIPSNMKRDDMVDALMHKMMGEAVSEINIKTKQKEAPKQTKTEKMGAFFGEEETTPKPKKEKITEETVKTDAGETITITPTGEGVTPASAIAKGLKMVSGEDATNLANETAQELNEDNYDNVEKETDDISDVINKCGRGI